MASTGTHAAEGEREQQEDAAQLASMGYKQQLTRRLDLLSNFSVGFTYLSPVVGVYTLFAYGLATAGPAVFWTIPLAVAGQWLVMLTFAEASSQWPIAGGVYQWARRLVGNRYAWFSWWFYTWALLVTIASATFSAALYMGPLFGYSVTRWSQIGTALVVLAIVTVINLSGVRNMALVAKLGLIAELIGSVVLGAIILARMPLHDLGVLFESKGAGAGNYAGAFLASILFAVWIFYGFEACGDIAEEVKAPSRKVPRAMKLTLLVGGLASAFITISFILATPNFGAVISGEDADPIGTIFNSALGTAGTKVALVMVGIAFVSCALSLQTATSRLLYSFARDGMIIGHRFIDRVSPRFHIPPGAVLIAAVIPGAIVFMPTATVARIITFAVVGIYVGFQSVVLASLIARARGWKPSGAFNLGKAGWAVNLSALAWGVFAIVVLCIKTPAYGTSFIDRWLVPVSLGCVAVLGVLYYVIFRPQYRVETDARADTAGDAASATAADAALGL
jgi:amino acid transporter